MASTTPNIGLTLPTGTEGWKRSVINGNFTILDTKIGAVGNTSLQSQINTLSSQMAKGVFISWGTSLTANNFHNGLLLLGSLLYTVWFASSADINIRAMTTPQFSKTSQNSVTFGSTSDTGTDYTITRNGTTITVTTNSNSTISILYV